MTSIVEGKINLAPAGLVDFTITEVSTGGIDGEILTVIFDDPAQTTDNTIILLFGAQNVAGDTFNIGLASPIDITVSNLLDMSLGISFSHQPASQYSQVDVNGQRMTTSAGGEDDGAAANGALLTVGGIGDVNTNPSNPNAIDGCGLDPRCDDELYNLLPFVNTGDTNIKVYTKNPSSDDNIFFAALNLKGVTAVVNQGITLTPPDATNPVGTSHTVTAKVQDGNGNPVAGRTVVFMIQSGPNSPFNFSSVTDANGVATFTYTSNGNPGTDLIQAFFNDDTGKAVYSNKVIKIWVTCTENCNEVPEFPTVALPIMSVLGIMFFMSRKKHN